MPANRVHFVDHREAHGEALFVRSPSWPRRHRRKAIEFRRHGRTAARMDEDEDPIYLWREALRFGDD